MNRELYGKLVFELSRQGRRGYRLPDNHIPDNFTPADDTVPEIPDNLLRRDALTLPECDELTVVRHYNNMSTNNFGVDTGFYPLGSCTMKYNPKINEEMATHRAFTRTHPAAPQQDVQGNMKLYNTLQTYISEIGGLNLPSTPLPVLMASLPD